MKFKLLLFFFLFPFFLIAQQSWSLKDCLIHAAEHNLSIKQAVLSTTLSKNALIESKLGVLPSLNTNASHSFNFGRSIDPSQMPLPLIGLEITISDYLLVLLYLEGFKMLTT